MISSVSQISWSLQKKQVNTGHSLLGSLSTSIRYLKFNIVPIQEQRIKSCFTNVGRCILLLFLANNCGQTARDIAMEWVKLHLSHIFNSNKSILIELIKLKSQNHAKNPHLEH